ncbi:hypothetical protein O6H91_04G075800 [Diphasiastrum complanatum]|nr:hypothetical protein O6H91_04G075800 [Diphasiastrum complanatum]KAJ7559248.1 hypothetical protein O6H91_04G075800 [Diphasiastrum complanatum]
MPPKCKNLEKTPEKHNGKEWKASPRHGSAGGTVSANAYNPFSGTFHAVAPDSGMPSHSGRFKTIDDGDDNASSVGASVECDSVSNNGSCSGESEDQTQSNYKEKHGISGSGSPPGLGSGSEKRDKIRWKNEKKHQRQKERRAKDLKDRSTGYLMSRKLEILAEQLASMGFPSDRATMALILNEGHVERSVAWLLEGGYEQVKEGWKIEGDLKIDISEELARIAELEIGYKYPRIEVERAIVACQGNVDKAAEWLRDRHPMVPESAAKSGKVNGTLEGSASMQPLQNSSAESACAQLQFEELQCKSNGVQVASRHKRGERQISANQSRVQPHVNGLPLRNSEASIGTGYSGRNSARVGLEGLKLSQKSTGRVLNSKLQTPSSVSQDAMRSLSSVSMTANLRSCFQTKIPVQNNQSEPKTFHSTNQQPFLSQKVSHASAGSAHHVGCTVPNSLAPTGPNLPGLNKYQSVTSSASSTAPDIRKPSGVVLKGVISTTSSAQERSRSNPEPESFRAMHSTMGEASERLNDLKSVIFSSETSFHSTNLELSSTYSPKTVQLSSELLAGWGLGAPGGYVDWSMASMTTCDYRTIDWSMPHSPSNSSETGLWGVYKGLPTTLNLQKESQHGQDFSKDLGSYLQSSTVCSSLSRDLGNYDIWGSSKLKGNSKTLGAQEVDSGRSSSLGVEEWTSPFAGKDLFTLSQQTVSSSSL